MIRVGNADIRCRVRCDVGNDIVVDLAIVRVQPEIDRDIRIQLLEGFYCILIDRSLCLVGIVFRPERDLIRL